MGGIGDGWHGCLEFECFVLFYFLCCSGGERWGCRCSCHGGDEDSDETDMELSWRARKGGVRRHSVLTDVVVLSYL
jgi:hypothetical protein